MWARHLKGDAALAAEYQNLGRSYTRQREFRRNWAKKEFVAYTSQRTITEGSTDHENVRCTPMNLSQLIWKLKNRTAAMNYFQSALRKHKAGEKIKDRDWLSINPMTKFVDIVFVEVQFGSDSWKEWKNVMTEAPTTFGNGGSGSGGSGSGGSGGGNGGSGTGGSVGGQIAAGQPPKAPKKPSGKEDNGAKHDLKQQQIKKDLDAQFACAKKLKIRLDEAQSHFSEVLGRIDSQSKGWTSWAMSERSHLESLKANLDAAKAKDDFWMMWSITPEKSFAVQAKKKFKADAIFQYFKETQSVERHVEELEKKLRTLQKMHDAIMSED